MPKCSSLKCAGAMKSVSEASLLCFALSNVLAPDERCVSIPSAMPIVLCYICIAERERAQPEIGVKTRLQFEIFPNHGFCPRRSVLYSFPGCLQAFHARTAPCSALWLLILGASTKSVALYNRLCWLTAMQWTRYNGKVHLNVFSQWFLRLHLKDLCFYNVLFKIIFSLYIIDMYICLVQIYKVILKT